MGYHPEQLSDMTVSLKQKITIPLILGLTGIVIILMIFFYFNKYLSEPISVHDIKIDTKAALKLNILKQISKKNGIKEWELEAACATLLKGKTQAVLVDVSIIFFTKDNKKIRLRSKKGILNTKTHDMVFSDHVVVMYENATLKTDKLQYNKKEHIIFSMTPVKLEKKDSIIEADSMITKLNKNMTILKGHVSGIFNENFNIQ